LALFKGGTSKHFLFNEGLLDSAIVCFTKVLDKSPNHISARLLRAKAYQKAYDIADAIEDLNVILKRLPNDTCALCTRGICFFWLKEYQKAIDDYTKAIEAETQTDDFLFYNRGAAYLEIGNYEEAEKDCTQALKFEEHHAETYTNRARARMHLGQLEEAEKDLLQALEEDINEIHAFSLLAELRTGLKEK
jgi:tetratricopeptide (TPR) repeat protein